MDTQAYIQSGIIESYVLGLANSEEVAEVDLLRKQHPELERAIIDFSLLLEHSVLDTIAPPPEVKKKIMKMISSEQAVFSAKNTTDESDQVYHTIIRSIRPWQIAAAASIILLVISSVFNFYLYNRYSEKSKAYMALLSERNSLYSENQVIQTSIHQWESAAHMMADPAMAVIKMKGIPGKEKNMATLFWDTRNKDVYIMPNKLPNPQQGKQYQLWALVDGKPIDAGVLDLHCSGACKMKNITRAQAFAITLENSGGSASPTLEQMIVKGTV